MPPIYPSDFFDDLRNIKRRLRSLEAIASKRPNSASTILGSLTVKDSGDASGLRVIDAMERLRAFFGRAAFATGTGHGFRVLRPNGTNVFEAYSQDDGTARLLIQDMGGNYVFSTDDVSGFGLSRPFLKVDSTPARVQDWPQCTSATFETVLNSHCSVWQSKVRVFGALYAPASTTCEARVMCNGAQIGSTFSVTNGYGTIDVTEAIPGITLGSYPETVLNIAELQLRRTAGSGTVAGILHMVETRKSA